MIIRRWSLNIDNQSTDEILKGIKNNHVDFGFISDIKDLDKYNNLEAILVKKEEYVLIVPKNHPLANKEEVYLSDLKNEYFIAYNNKSSDVEKSYSDLIGYTPKIYAELVNQVYFQVLWQQGQVLP